MHPGKRSGSNIFCGKRKRQDIFQAMLSRIEVQNFRGLSALDVELAPATVLVGPNSCGKTTVLHAVQLACSALNFAFERRAIDEDKQEDGWLTLYSDKPIRDDQQFLPTTRWYELFSDADPDKAIKIRLHFSEEHAIKQIYVDLHVGRADALRMTVAIQAAKEHSLRAQFESAAPGRGRRRAELHAALLEQIGSHLPRAVFIPAFYGVVREEEYRSRAAVEAQLQGGQQGQVVRNLLVRLESLEDLNDFLALAGLQARVDSCTPQQKTDTTRYLEVLFRDRNGPLELSSAGTGLASMLALYAAIRNSRVANVQGRAVLFMFDEPEAHLHPRLQGEVAARLLEMVTKAGAQLLCATHSVEMINRLGRDPRALVLRIDRDRGGQVRTLYSEEERMDDLSAWCDLSPFAQLNLLSTRRIVFFEGPSDYKILRRCAELHLGSDPSRLDRVKDFTPAQLDGTPNSKAKDLFKKALEPIFKQLPAGEQVRVVRILDRDYGRPPTIERQIDEKAHYEELDVVWSRHSIESLFLDPECLTEWLDAALRDPQRPPELDKAAILKLVQAAVIAADKDPQLNEDAKNKILPNFVDGRTDHHIMKAISQAKTTIENEPAIYQRGKDRAKFVLDHVRQALFADPQTKRLANRVRRDIAQLVDDSPLRPNLLLPPALIPPEIKQVLDFMAPSGTAAL